MGNIYTEDDYVVIGDMTVAALIGYRRTLIKCRDLGDAKGDELAWLNDRIRRAGELATYIKEDIQAEREGDSLPDDYFPGADSDDDDSDDYDHSEGEGWKQA